MIQPLVKFEELHTLSYSVTDYPTRSVELHALSHSVTDHATLSAEELHVLSLSLTDYSTRSLTQPVTQPCGLCRDIKLSLREVRI
jgi:hypothetical protein